MTSKEFDNYSFSINTKVKEYGYGYSMRWNKVEVVDFRSRRIVTTRKTIIFCEDIMDIKD